MASGMVAFLAFSAILIGAQILHIRERREQLVLEDLPRLAGLAKDYFFTQFDTTASGLALLASVDDWPERLAMAPANPQRVLDWSVEWARILDVPYITVGDIQRGIIYPYWSEDYVVLDPTLQRDAWFFDVWAVESPPERRVTFYFDETVGGHAFYLDQLIRDESGQPLGLIGAFVEVSSIVQRMARDLRDNEYVYVIDDADEVVAKVTRDEFVIHSPVYTTGETTLPGTASADYEWGIDPLHIVAAESEDFSFVADPRFVSASVNLPIAGMRARVFLNVETRLSAVRAAALQQIVALLALFTVLIGGYIVLVTSYARRSRARMQLIRSHRERLDDLLAVLTHNLSNDLHALRLVTAPHSGDRMGCDDEVFSHVSGVGTHRPAQSILMDMEQVLQNAVYSARLGTHDIRSFARWIAPEQVLERLRETCDAVALQKGQELVIHDAARRSVCIDEDILFHVVLNLVSNAIKFAPCGSRVVIATHETENASVIAVVDQGPGFAPNERGALFVKHRRLSARPTGGERSTGMGLYVTHNLAASIGVHLELAEVLPEWLRTAGVCGEPIGAIWLVHIPRTESS